MDSLGIAAIITALLTPISLVVLAWLQIQAKATGEAALVVSEATLEVAHEVNHAVNGKDPRDTTLSEDVITIRDKQELDLPTLLESDSNGTSAAILPLLRALAIEVADISKRVPTVPPV